MFFEAKMEAAAGAAAALAPKLQRSGGGSGGGYGGRSSSCDKGTVSSRRSGVILLRVDGGGSRIGSALCRKSARMAAAAVPRPWILAAAVATVASVGRTVAGGVHVSSRPGPFKVGV